ncbi:MAG: hypothetical protein B7Z20_06420, partial [Sphingobium sp. 32-64-5]
SQILVEGWRQAGLNVQIEMKENWGQVQAAGPDIDGEETVHRLAVMFHQRPDFPRGCLQRAIRVEIPQHLLNIHIFLDRPIVRHCCP